MDSARKTARVAGFLYLIVVITGIFSLAYVPSQLIVWRDAGQTFANISESPMLFRLDIASGIICYVAFLLLPLFLYQLLHTVNKNYAVAMVALAAVSVPISMVALVNKLNVLMLIDRARSQVDVGAFADQVLQHLNYYNNGISIASVFWGLWLFPFGYLVFKSGFLPKIFGILLMAGCLGYMINIFGDLIFENYASLRVSRIFSLPARLGEIGICFWLLIVGVKAKTVSLT